MKLVKRIVILLLAALLVCTNSVIGFASVSPSATEVVAGQTATVTFSYNNIAGIEGTFSFLGDDIAENIEVTFDDNFVGEYKEGTNHLAYFANEPSTFTCTINVNVKASATAGQVLVIDFEYETTADGKLPSVPEYEYESATIEVIEIDYTALEAAIAEAQALIGDDYTTDSWANLQAALATAIAARTSTSQAVVDNATNALKAAINALVKKPVSSTVNYDALNAAIAEAEALNASDYTADSWANLENALNAAIAARNSTSQTVVDEATANLKDAIAALVKKPVTPTVNYDALNAAIAEAQALNKDEYTTDSWANLAFALENAIAARNSTSQTVVDTATNALKSAINALVKKPVPPAVNYDALNAAIAEAEALNKDDYTADSWVNLEVALTNAIAARNSNLQSVVDAATDALKDAIAALVKKPVTPAVNYDALNQLIEAAQALNKDEYTADSWAALETALDKAIAALTSTSQDEVDAAARQLQLAINGLVKKQPAASVNYDELNKLIEEALALKKEDYTEDSWATLQNALNNAILAKTSDDQAVVDAAAKALKEAIAGLVKKPAPVAINYDQLNKLIEAAQKLNKNDYTKDSWAKLEAALATAIAARESTVQSVVDAAAKSLQVAINGLVKKQPATKVNYDKLNELIEAALLLNKSDYTAESWAVLEAALDNAVIAKTSNDQSVVDAAAKALEDAINGLVKVSSGVIDYTKLNEQIEIAEGLDSKKYTKDSWANLEEKLAKAIEARKATTQEEVDFATAELKAAIDSLEERAGFPWWILIIIAVAAVVVVVIIIKSRKKDN